jgi:hypothetical protein
MYHVKRIFSLFLCAVSAVALLVYQAFLKDTLVLLTICLLSPYPPVVPKYESFQCGQVYLRSMGTAVRTRFANSVFTVPWETKLRMNMTGIAYRAMRSMRNQLGGSVQRVSCGTGFNEAFRLPLSSFQADKNARMGVYCAAWGNRKLTVSVHLLAKLIHTSSI